MSRAALDTMLQALDAAYRTDRYQGLLGNLSDVRDDEWDTRPANHSADVFGTVPELSIADIVRHVAAAKLMYANHAFGDASLDWPSTAPPSADRAEIMSWLDAAHTAFVDTVAALDNDAELDVERPIHTGRLLPTKHLLTIIINHDLYHSGEINRQRALIRGASGWDRP
ncbi:MAG: DinB family protein [Dehalococcoidia bacterium]|jgi:uncharacterized damage-inducible protein DinB|nr:DinB family protein [Dehalococcoidia bacterium]